VYTPAIPADHTELNYFLNREFVVRKRAKLLGEITKDKFTIAVGGTHGKTTTAAMITHMLKVAGIDCTALLGGISVNYGSNYIKSLKSESEIFVVEADEFDESFLQLNPDICLITSTEPDHLDVYNNHENLKNAYNKFLQNIKYNGKLVHEYRVDLIIPSHLKSTVQYGFGPRADYSAFNIRVEKSNFIFDAKTPYFEMKDLHPGIVGDHNILNALGALSVCTEMIHDPKVLKSAIESFAGVKRRFEFVIKQPNLVLVDDYAHHPTEINAALQTLKKLYPEKRITGIFQPHLYSRTLDFTDDFAHVLGVLDRIILLDIYPARELPIKGVSSYNIWEKIPICEKYLTTSKCLHTLLKNDENEVFITLGAGDIDRMVMPICNYLLDRKI
jgi:UDP-N-acetylmuramate--alanine ligase